MAMLTFLVHLYLFAWCFMSLSFHSLIFQQSNSATGFLNEFTLKNTIKSGSPVNKISSIK